MTPSIIFIFYESDMTNKLSALDGIAGNLLSGWGRASSSCDDDLAALTRSSGYYYIYYLRYLTSMPDISFCWSKEVTALFCCG